MDPMDWTIVKNWAYDSIALSVEATPLGKAAELRISLRVQWMAAASPSSAGFCRASEELTTIYSSGEALTEHQMIQRCSGIPNLVFSFAHVNALGAGHMWGEEIVAFAGEAVRAAYRHGSRGVEMIFRLRVSEAGAGAASTAAAANAGRRLPARVLGKVKRGSFREIVGGEQCSICWEKYKKATQVAQMPCFHVFHDQCLLPWLQRKKSCPVCRFEI